jgi:hypothetical protein
MEVQVMEEKTVVQQRPRKSPGFAGFLGIFPLGIGAFYNGQWLKGLLYLVVFGGLIDAFRHRGSGVFIAFLLTGFVFFQFFDNIQSARAINLAAAGQKPVAGAVEGLPEAVTSGSIFWGIFLIALGVLLILGNFQVIAFWENLGRLWPIGVIIIGLMLLLDSIAKAKSGK